MMRSLPLLAFPFSSATAQGWATSLVLHTVVVSAAVAMLSDVTLVPKEEPFKWEVSIVEAPVAPDRPQAASAPTPPSEPSEPRSVAAVAPAAETEPVMPAPALEPVREEVQPVAEATRPVQALVPVETNPVVEPAPEPVVHQAVPEKPQERVRPIETQPVETPAPAPEPVKPQPVVQRVEPPIATMQAKADAEPVKNPEPVVAKAAPVEPLPARPPSEHAVPRAPQVPAATTQPVAPITTAKAAPTGVDKPRADYGWIAQSLYKRVVELKRYPHRARLNHWEGKVVLRAVIRHDGHLADLALHQSSGHDELDEAAMELVREACPLHMAQPLGREQIVVQVPITYALR